MTIQNSVLKFENLFNGEDKKRFISQYDSVDSQLTIYWQFLKVADFEGNGTDKVKGLNKDMSEMTSDEIWEMLKFAKCSTITSAINHINTYKRYIDFMNVEHNPFYDFDSYSELASEVMDKTKNKRYSREDLMFMIDELNNYTDQALLLALFEGIKGKSFSELLTLKRSNLTVVENLENDLYYADVYDKGTKEIRRVNISEDLYKLLILADKQSEYRTNNQDETVETPFNDSEFIFKKAKKGKQGGSTLDRHFITRKFVFFKEFFGNDGLTADDILQSGMMYMAYQLYLKSGKIGKEELLIVGDHYDTIMATSNGKDYYRNITDLKRKIFTDELEKVYPKLKGIKYTD